jgi:hypothetical protein
MKINNEAIRCYDKRRTMTKINFIWITKHKRATADSGILIQMEIPKLVRISRVQKSWQNDARVKAHHAITF